MGLRGKTFSSIWTQAQEKTKRESKLMQNIQIFIQQLEKSEFYSSFLQQMQKSDMQARFLKVLMISGKDSKKNKKKILMVIYGIGSIKESEHSRLQLSLTILIRRKFDWIREIQVYNPILNSTETRVMTSLGFCVLSINEECRRLVSKPTMFFMPYYAVWLYDNLLQVNWGVDKLNRIILLGNSFEVYERPYFDSFKHLQAPRRFCQEFEVDDFSDNSFRGSFEFTWHFFCPVAKTNFTTLDVKSTMSPRHRKI